MFVEKVKNNGIDYLRLVQGVRTNDKFGNKTIRKKTILNIGPLSKYDDNKPDYMQRLKSSFKNGNPLIDSLRPYCDGTKSYEEYKFNITEGSPECIGHPKLYSHCLIEQILDELGIISVITAYKSFSKIEYDLTGFIRLLLYGRILDPVSKISTVKQNDDYYEPVICGEIYKYNVYDSLDFIYNHKKQLINRINTTLIKHGKRKTNIIYYDVTNFFFEIEQPDDDIVDNEGEVTEKGLRKMGVSKENRKQPIVQMGLFMDENGYPISIEIFPGNTLDHLTVQKALSNNIDDVLESRYIFIGDRGICNYVNLCHLIANNKGYIISKSIKKSTDKEKEWILKQEDYIKKEEGFKYKSRVVTKTVKNQEGENVDLTIKEVVYFSKKFYDKEMKENQSFLEFLKKLEESPNNFKITTAQSKGLKKFFKKDVLNNETGEMIDSSKIKLMIDFDKIKEYIEYFGYYQIITSEVTMDSVEIIKKYHGLSQIENQFRMMKGTLEARPLFVQTKEHIESHLLICIMSLVVIRVIQNKIVEKKGKNEGFDWELGLSAERIKNALNNWTVDKFPDNYYRFNNIDSQDLKIIIDSFDIKIPTKLFKKQELRSLKKSIKVFC